MHAHAHIAGYTAVLDLVYGLFSPLARAAHAHNAAEPDEEAQDKLAASGCATLHTFLGIKKADAPVYAMRIVRPPGAKGDEGRLFEMKCVLEYEGKT